MKINKDAVYLFTIALLIALCGQFYYSYRYQPAHEVNVYYNQNIEANELLADVIRNADQFVYFAIYTFTRTDIKNALLGAKHRGLDVRGITDANQLKAITEQAALIAELQAAGIPISTQDHSSLMHMKVLVTDKSYVSGSYNWTTSATKTNDEVLEVGQDEDIRKQYQNVLEEMFEKYNEESG
jgi:phosphatidylserine/phosphatidylglycerophosphate/cardiolipin synthase-like enzyme